MCVTEWASHTTCTCDPRRIANDRGNSTTRTDYKSNNLLCCHGHSVAHESCSVTTPLPHAFVDTHLGHSCIHVSFLHFFIPSFNFNSHLHTCLKWESKLHFIRSAFQGHPKQQQSKFWFLTRISKAKTEKTTNTYLQHSTPHKRNNQPTTNDERKERERQ